MKIIISIPCLLRGGTEIQTMLLARALIELRHDVAVCCYFERDEQVVAEFHAAGATVRLLGWSRSLGTATFIRSLAAIFRETSPSVVHVQYMAPGLLPIIAARLAKVPVVFATVHQPGTPHGLKARSFIRFGTFLCHRFTCVSEAAERSWFGSSFLLDPEKSEGLKGRRHLTIPNAVDMAAIDAALSPRSALAIDLGTALTGKRIIGAVGRLSREKGIDILIRAFPEIKRAVPEAHLLIVGDGNERERLVSLAQQLGIAPDITWTGALLWEDAIGCMGLMEAVVVPSRFEGFGLTAVEAMACGKPIVASLVDGLAEVIRDGVTGCLAPTEDVSAFALLLTALLQNEEWMKTIGNTARRHVQEYYAYDRFRERCRVLYESLIVSP